MRCRSAGESLPTRACGTPTTACERWPRASEPASSSRISPAVIPPRYAVKGAFGRKLARRGALLLDVSDQLVTFGLQLTDAPLDDVPDADNGDQLAIDDDRDVTHPALRHDLGQVLDAVLRAAGLHIAGHDRRNGRVQHANAVSMKVAHDVPLADYAGHRRAIIADHDRTDMVLIQDLQESQNRRVRANGHHLVAFSADHV